MSTAIALAVMIAMLLCLLIVAALKQVVVDEILASAPWLGRILIRSAARKLPEEHRQRYEHEWLAELNSSRALQGLLYALGVRLGVRSTIAELRTENTTTARRPPPERESRASDPVLARLAVTAILERTAPPSPPWDDIRQELRDAARSLDLDFALSFATNRFTALLDDARSCRPYDEWLRAHSDSAILGRATLHPAAIPDREAMAAAFKGLGTRPTDLRIREACRRERILLRRRAVTSATLAFASIYGWLSILSGSLVYVSTAFVIVLILALTLRITRASVKSTVPLVSSKPIAFRR